MRKALTTLSLSCSLILSAILLWPSQPQAQSPKRVYIANDDHTDYMWSGDEAQYRQEFIRMIDYYLDQTDSTAGAQQDYQGRFNLDGTFWIWEYERNKNAAELQRLVDRIKDGHFSVPLTPLVILPGGMPLEAVLRAMYYGGQLERRFNMRLNLAVAMENQTLPYGVASLWAGAGAKYSWRGVCSCATRIGGGMNNRDREIYWFSGPDGSRVLMKWNSIFSGDNQRIGGYGEARSVNTEVGYATSDATFISKYPFNVIGIFGYGWDDLSSFRTDFITQAPLLTNSSRRVIVSNQEDFFRDFESTYGASLQSFGASFGNEWDLYSASMSELSAKVKRDLEKLRAAEALAAVVVQREGAFMSSRKAARDQAMINLGMYFEHDWTADGPISRNARRDWQRRVEAALASYVDSLYSDGLARLAALIGGASGSTRFFAFNPLGWSRTDYADFLYTPAGAFHVTDLASNQDVPAQLVTVGSNTYVRIIAANVPAVGYRVYEIRSGAGSSFSTDLTQSGSTLENNFYRLTLANNGAISSLIDKTRSSFEYAGSGRLLNALDGSTSTSGTLSLENSGPVSITLKATSSAPLQHDTRVTLFRQIDRVMIENAISSNQFASTQYRTWNFNFNLTSPELWHEEVGAVIRAKLLAQGGHYSPKNARYDWLTLNHFADLSAAGAQGVVLSNPDLYFMQYGNSTVTALDTATASLKVLAGGQVDGTGLGIQSQGGDTSFLQRFALSGHTAYSQANAMRFALEHQNPLLTSAVGGSAAAFPGTSFSLLQVSDSDVLLWAVKPSDDVTAPSLVVRLWNQKQSSAAAQVIVPNGSIQSAKLVTHVETETGNASLSSGQLNETIAAQQVRSFSIVPQLSGSADGLAPNSPQNLTVH